MTLTPNRWPWSQDAWALKEVSTDFTKTQGLGQALLGAHLPCRPTPCPPHTHIVPMLEHRGPLIASNALGFDSLPLSGSFLGLHMLFGK